MNMQSYRPVIWAAVLVACWLAPAASHGALFFDRATFEASFNEPGMALATDDFEDVTTYLVDVTAAGHTRNGIQYVGNMDDYGADPQWNPALFPFRHETFITPSGAPPYSTYSLKGSNNVFGGRSSLDVNLPAGILAFGFDVGFDTNDPPLPQDAALGRPYDAPLAADETTMLINFYDAGNLVLDSVELKLGAAPQFVGFLGSGLDHILFDSLLPEKNPGYIKDQVSGHGYWAYTILDDVTYNVAVPEPSTVVLSMFAAVVLTVYQRGRIV